MPELIHILIVHFKEMEPPWGKKCAETQFQRVPPRKKALDDTLLCRCKGFVNQCKQFIE